MSLRESECLDLIERGAWRHPLDRALLLAAVADPRVNWADRPLGERDACLMALRCEWFGPWFDAVIACNNCRKLLSLRVDLRVLAERVVKEDSPVEVDGACLRRPTTRDLAALVGQLDAESAATALLRRLTLTAPAEGWTDTRRAGIEAALDDADPLAHIALDITCEHCESHFSAPLDIGATLWDELSTQAEQVIDDVHMLASAYGWSESEILTMSAARRALYKRRVVA